MSIQTQGFTQGTFLNKCEVMLTGAQANATVPGVQDRLFPLQMAIEGAKEAQAERALQRAKAQQSSRDLDEHLTTANEIYSQMRRLLHAFFGPRSEKLVEFGLLPLRPVQKAKPNPEAPEQT
ncbi:MAG TPA: hypothetical protein VE078_15670, partial [Thermoanaerobaculia bacterium]|nr:hypothetical protein [Thermoanaerobaculia bacterium]